MGRIDYCIPFGNASGRVITSNFYTLKCLSAEGLHRLTISTSFQKIIFLAEKASKFVASDKTPKQTT